MNPESVVAMVTALAEAFTELSRFLQTPEGQALLEQARKDRAAFQAGMKATGDWFTHLLQGRL